MRAPRTVLVCAVLAAAGCDVVTDLQHGSDAVSSPVVNGSNRPEAVQLSSAQALAVGAVLTQYGGGWTNTCTGTLIAPDVVLTAAHCFFDDDGRKQSAADLAFAIGTDAANPRESAGVSALHVHAGYDKWGDSARNDVAILVLDTSLSAAEPLPFNCDALGSTRFVGQTVQNVGFGDTATEGSDNTRKWWVTGEVVALSAFDFTVDGGGEAGVCTGDSGGPSLLTFSGQVRVAGVLSWGDYECGQRDHFSRVDDYCDFIRPFIAAPAPVATPDRPASDDGCSIEGVLFDGPALERALQFMRTATCEECDEILDARTCEDAINDANSCQVGTTCTGCDDSDTRDDGVSCAELAAYAYFGATGAQALHDHVGGGGGATVSVEGVAFTDVETAAVLDLVNSAAQSVLDDNVGLDSRAASEIVADRPIASLDDLAAISYVGEAALRSLRDYVR